MTAWEDTAAAKWGRSVLAEVLPLQVTDVVLVKVPGRIDMTRAVLVRVLKHAGATNAEVRRYLRQEDRRFARLHRFDRQFYPRRPRRMGGK